MTTETPKTGAGDPLCAWCGQGPVPPSRGTKPRAYCSRSCVQRAYEARRVQERVLKAYAKGRADGIADVGSGKSRDDGTGGGKSRDFPGDSQVTAPGGESCPYCGHAVVHLVDHLRHCQEGPGIGEPDAQP